MERWKTVLKKLLFPGWGWVALAVLLGGGSLALTFLVFGEDSPFAYAAYLLSAYALTVLAAAVAPLFPAARRGIHRIPLAHRYMTDQYFKVRAGLALSLCVNLCYAGFKLVCAAWYASVWDGALAVYYVLLCAVRVYLLRRVPRDGQGRDVERELRHYRATGVFLLVLDLQQLPRYAHLCGGDARLLQPDHSRGQYGAVSKIPKSRAVRRQGRQPDHRPGVHLQPGDGHADPVWRGG